MLVKVFNSLAEIDEFDIAESKIQGILNAIKSIKGSEYTDKILEGKFSYIVGKSLEDKEPIVLLPDVILSDLSDFSILYIIADISGSEPISATMILSASIAMTGSLAVDAAVAGLIALVANISILAAAGFALSSIMSALSPTPTFSSDPAQTQSKQSSLFNGAPLIREQGGSVPMVFGSPYCGGVLISSSITTADIL